MRLSTLGALASTTICPCLATSLTDNSSPRLVPRQNAAPPVANFVRRADVAVTTLDDYLYIVGGGVSVRDPKSKDDVEAQVAGLNTTLALSLKEDWKSEDAQYSTIPANDFPKSIGHALWSNPNAKEVVFWGGLDFGIDRTGARDPRVWTLAADGNGGGKWTSKEPPESIKRTAFGAYAECGGKGFFAGGFGDSSTDADEYQSRVAAPGLIIYDLKDGTFRNESTEGLTSSGAFQKGSAVCVELPNRKPKLFVVGGAEITPTNVADNNVDIQTFDNAYFYDLEKEKWFKQETQGSRPAPRQGTCAVGAAGPNNTYEIFMYGGFRDGGGPMDDAWVLSIPAFRWFQVDARSDTRYSHACARHGSQMIVVGGNDDPVWNKRDPFPQGLGVFSLNDLSWMDGFEAKSAKYRSPQVVRDWYDARGHDTIPWGSNEIKESFLGTSNEQSNEPSAPSPTPTPEAQSEETNNTAAIVGGTVGGVLALAAIGGGFWFWRRRKARHQEHNQIVEADESFAMKPANTWTNVSEIDSTTRTELDSPAGERAAEARWGNKPRVELQGSGHHDAVELPA